MDKPLTVSEALRFANHDFLNQLHLIQMYLDLQRVDEAKKLIQQIAEQSKMLSNVNKLGLPKTIEWLQTVSWRYPAWQVTLNSDVQQAADALLDSHIVQYLENTVIHLDKALDPYTEQALCITVECHAGSFLIEVQFSGQWEAVQFNNKETKLTVHVLEETNNSWHFILSE